MSESKTLHQVYLGLGSNIDPEYHLCAMLQRLKTTFGELTISTAYRTKAVGFIGEDFINLVVGFKTDWSETELIEYLKQAEQALGRNNQQGYQARTVDADLLLYEGTLIAHKDIERYPFVLYPLVALAPTFIHPMQRCTLSELAERLQLPQTDMQIITLKCWFE